MASKNVYNGHEYQSVPSYYTGSALNVLCGLCAGTTNQIKDGSIVRKCRVADKTASICFSLWNEQAEAIEAGDILRLVKG